MNVNLTTKENETVASLKGVELAHAYTVLENGELVDNVAPFVAPLKIKGNKEININKRLLDNKEVKDE